MLLVVVFLAACKPVPKASPFTLRIAVSGPLDKVEPEARTWSVIAKALVLEPLISIGQTGDIEPVLAARVEEAGPDALRVWLRPDARFSDGTAVSFADVEASFASSKLRVIDEGPSILFRSNDSSAPTELLLSRAPIFRRTSAGVLGTGAFEVEEQDPTHVLLARSHSAAGFIERVLLNSYPTPQDAFARTLKGDADMLPEVKPRWIEFFEGVPRMKVLRANGTHANMVAFNSRRLSRDERIALAGLLATDEVRLLAFGDDCAPPMRRPGIEPISRGRSLDVLTIPFFDRFAAAVRRALGPRGGEVREAEVQEVFSAIRAGNFDLATIRPAVWPPFMATLIWRTGASYNVFSYSNPAVDAALDARDWRAARRALDADPPGAFICTPPSVVVIDARIKTPALEAGRFYESLPQWEVSQ